MPRAKSLSQIDAEIAKLQQQRDALRAKEVAEVIGRIKDAIRHYSLTPQDLFGSDTPSAPRQVSKTSKVSGRAPVSKPRRSSSQAGKRVAVKFKDANGNVWTGRGSQPRWLRDALAGGATLDSFRIAAD